MPEIPGLVICDGIWIAGHFEIMITTNKCNLPKTHVISDLKSNIGDGTSLKYTYRAVPCKVGESTRIQKMNMLFRRKAITGCPVIQK